jgi:hypothetical protein
VFQLKLAIMKSHDLKRFNFINKDNRDFIIINIAVENVSYLFIFIYRFIYFMCSFS